VPNRDHRVERSDVRVFSSASDAPWARRPTDVVLLIVATLVTVLLSFPAPGPTAIDAAVADLVAAIPGLFGWFWELSYDLVVVWAVILILGTLFAHGRLRLLAGEVLAACTAVVLAAGAGIVSGTDLADSLGPFAASAPPAVYPAMRISVAVAVIVTASPHLSRPLRYIGRWVVAIGAIGTIALGVALPLGVVVAVSIGVGAASLVHLLLGSPGGRLSLAQIAAALGDLGVEATDVRNVRLNPAASPWRRPRPRMAVHCW
jgi:hypothetical protein